MPIKFEKTQEKLRKNLMKEFETFNHNKQQSPSHSNKKYDSDSVKPSSYSHQSNPNKPPPHAQMTTDVKSPLLKSASSSKLKLVEKQRRDSLAAHQSNVKSIKSMRSSKKSLNQRVVKLLPQNPAVQQLVRSRQSSPQAQRVYSKLSNYDKRPFSKISNYKKHQSTLSNDFQRQSGLVANSSSKASVLKQQKKRQPQSQTNNTKIEASKLTIQKLSSNNNKSPIQKPKDHHFNYQISFPQMVTESESVYPSSSQPNTGKQSQARESKFWEKKRNSNILQEEEQQFQENIHIDYIEEGQNIQPPEEPSKYMSQGQDESYPNEITFNGYSQIPKSYLLAMQILQAKVHEQQNTIKRLQDQLQNQDIRYHNLQAQITKLQTQFQNQLSTIAQKDSQIKFLKGYLDQEKHNNREALKQVAKNVYERTMSAKKTPFEDYSKQQTHKSYQKVKNNLYVKDQRQKTANKKSNIKDKQNLRSISQNQQKSRPTQQMIEEDQDLQVSNQKSEFSLIEHSRQSDQVTPKKQQAPKKPSSQIKQQKIQPQKNREQQILKQKLIQEQFVREELVKDQLMREKIIREEAMEKVADKKYQYLEQSPRKYRAVSLKEGYPYTVKKTEPGDWQLSGRQIKQDGERQLYSEGKRMRSMSTAIKYLDKKMHPNLTYRPSTAQKPTLYQQFTQRANPTLTPSVQSIIDPVLQRYIQAKSDISSYRFENGQTAFFHQGKDLKSENRHKRAVSEMRELMRGEKQLVALNYKLEAIEKRILQCVKSNGNDSIKQQVDAQIKLEDLQKQYTMMKKEFERKELYVKELRLKLQAKDLAK